MTSLKIYQIGVRDFGRYGFEKLVEMHRHLEEVDVELTGVCDRDFDALEEAEKFASANSIEIETFQKIDDLYRKAEEEDGKVMIYDAGPVETRPEHIYRSMRNGFFHLSEKPPSLSREQHIEERKLAGENDVFWKADFIERENPAVKKATELLDGENIESIRVFRESSTGVQKLLQPVKLSAVKGGDVLDKLTNDIYILDFLDAAGEELELELETAEANYLMPKNVGSDSLMTVNGSKIEEIDGRVATAQTAATFSISGTEVELHSSWLGLNDEARRTAAAVEDSTGHRLLRENYTEASGKAFHDEEARFFVVEGSRSLVGDLISGRLFDLEKGDEIEVPYLLHDQLYRVIEKAVFQAYGREKSFEGDEIDIFMNAVFDIRDEAIKNTDDFFEELQRANRKISGMIVEDISLEDDEVKA